MASRIKTKIIALVLICICLVVGNLQSLGAASSVSLSLDPSSVTVAQGNNFTVEARLDSGNKTIDSIDIYLNYDPNSLDFVSIDSSQSSFGIGVTETGGSGEVHIIRGALPPFVEGDTLISNIIFKPKVGGSGPVNTTISYTDQSVAASEGESVAIDAKSGASINVTPNDNANPSESGQGDPQASYNNPNELIAVDPETPITVIPNDPAAPKLIDVFPSTVGFKTVVISWRTNVPANAFVEYGLTEKLGFNVSARDLSEKHELQFDASLTKPGQKYYYRVKSADANGNTTSSGIRYLITRGYTAVIAVGGVKNPTIEGTQVFLDKAQGSERTSTLDREGQTTFYDIAPGEHLLSLSYNNQEVTQPIVIEDALGIESGEDVAPDAHVTPQYFRIELGAGRSLLSTLKVIGVALAVLGLLSGGGFFIWSRYHSGGLHMPKIVNRKRDIKNQHSTSEQQIPPTEQSEDLDSILTKLPGDRVTKPGQIVKPTESSTKVNNQND